MSSPRTESVPIIIVGGSLVGLTTALCLAHHNIQATVLERHPGISGHPRALGFTSRTMEIFRALGFQHKIKEADPDFKLLRARVESLAGEWYERFPWTENQDSVDPLSYSISPGAAIAQDQLEGILREEALAKGVDLRCSNTLVDFVQEEGGVRATVKDEKGEEYTLEAPYMIAADGNRSRIRQKLGIEREGEKDGKGKMGTINSVMFRAPLEEYLEEGISQFNIEQPDLKAFMTHYLDGRWALMFRDGKERSHDELMTAIYQAIGRKDISVEILTTGQWELSMLIADKFRSGSVFLAGDAAHTLPPNRGGYGANTGIADAWNIAWKLAAVLNGSSRAELLDSYEAERRPVALLRKQQISLRADYKVADAAKGEEGTIIDDVAMEVGEYYESDAIANSRKTHSFPPAARPEQWKGQPGTRFAHQWMTKRADSSERFSTLDLFGKDWVLISESEEWIKTVETVNETSSVKIHPVHTGPHGTVFPEDVGTFRSLTGTSLDGAMLIRPDGVIAWRHHGLPQDMPEVLKDVLRQVAAATQC